MIPLTLVTGFLGSGKTTLLKRIARRNLGGVRQADLLGDTGEAHLPHGHAEGVLVDVYDLSGYAETHGRFSRGPSIIAPGPTLPRSARLPP